MPEPRGRGARLRRTSAKWCLPASSRSKLPVCFDRGGDGLPIDHLGAAGPDVGVKFPLQAVLDHLQVQFAHAGEQDLAGVFVGGDL